MGGIDREKVKGSFHRQAKTYDQYARVQKRVVANLLDQVRKEVGTPGRILDVGCGTGKLLAELHRLHPEAQLFGADLALGMCITAGAHLAAGAFVTADAESLPFIDGAFNLVTSTSTYQWLPALDHAFAEARRVLAPGGIFLFALFGERTLFELKDAHYQALKREGEVEDITHRFFPPSRVEAALAGAGFDQWRVESTLEVELHADVPALLKSLKKIGAGNASPRASAGLYGRKRMLAMMDIYQEKYGTTDGIPATYEVIYGAGRCP
ncbi:methyltransferase domain-containing protein [Geotalea sp. SG265]|uniref:methyltransferase domain-containing protein n=1 Tax=Geotalea sp. SG265 TaxID=2922867 RepID=UPI001FAEAD8E|nr:methyltransferase domain-containing protein [Geotalea sp. SG265]